MLDAFGRIRDVYIPRGPSVCLAFGSERARESRLYACTSKDVVMYLDK